MTASARVFWSAAKGAAIHQDASFGPTKTGVRLALSKDHKVQEYALALSIWLQADRDSDRMGAL
jgi:hypothetical protein